MTIKDIMEQIRVPDTRPRALRALGLTHKDVLVCKTCGREFDLTENGVRKAVRHARKAIRRNDHSNV
jgi:Fe2+ or Zn2+ uptake regulation protein